MKTLYLCLILIISVIIIPTATGQIPQDKALALWIGEGKGDIAKDLSGNGKDGALKDGAKWVPGKFGSGISLEGKGSYLEISNVLVAEGSIEFWFKPNWNGSDGPDYRIFDASMGGIYFFISKGAAHADITPKDFGFYLEDAADADWQDVEFDPKDVIKAGKWFHVAATWKFNGGNPFLYIDGKQIATSANKLGGFPILNPKPRFGTEVIKYIPITNGADGVIDEIAIYTKALTEKEIKRDMEASSPVEAVGKLTTIWSRIKVGY
jgi:hypothetical protein